MIDNGGVVIRLTWSLYSSNVVMTEWVPLTRKKLELGVVRGQATEGGGTATFTVELAARPSAAVTVTVTSRDASEGTASPSSLTFETSNWNTAQTVTVTGVDDATDDGDVTWRVRLDPSSGGDANYNRLANEDVWVTTRDDDDAPGVTLTVSPSSISENGGAATVTATLSHPSLEATTLTVTAVSGFYTVGSDAVIVIAAGATVNATDTATIAAVNNDTDAPDRAGTVTATVSNDMGAGSVSGGALTVTDDDAAPNAELSLNPASVSENGGVSAVSATLTRASSEATTVTVTAVSGLYTVGSDAVIVIAAGETANATDTAAIAAVDNAKDEPDRTATVTATLTNSQGTGTVSGPTLTLEDDDAAPGVALTVASSAIPENGGSTTVSATLTHGSSEPTTVTVTTVSGLYTVGSDATIVIAAGSTTSTDRATIAAVDNDVDAADSDVTVTGTAANGQAAANSETMTVTGASLTITDDDTAGFVVSPSRLRTTESGGTAAFTVKLATRPTGDVVLGVASSDTAEGTVSTSLLTFTATTWNTAQTVTLTGVDDPTADGNRNYTVTLTVDMPGTGDATYNGLSPVTVYAVNVDNEYGLELGAVRGQATEGGGTATFTVELVARPLAAVTVTVTSRDASEGTASPSSLNFETSDWNTARTVTVTGVDDATDDGDVTWAVRLDPSSDGDANYNRLANEDVWVTTRDNDDAPGVTLSLEPASVSENGGVTRVTATLSHPSVAATTVTVVPVAPAVAGDYTQTGTTLTIAAGSMASVGTVTIAANDNKVDAANKRVTVSGTAMNARAAADSATVAVTAAELTITDDDEKGFVLRPAEFLEVTEGGAPVAYTVALTSEPVGAVAVAVAVDNPFLSVSPAGLTFTATDWEQAQTVTVTARDDGNEDAEPSSLSHRASGGGYGGVSGSLPVSVEGETTVRVGGGASGTTTYFIEGRRVTVTVMAGAPEGIVVDFAGSGALARDVVLRFAPPAAGVPLESARFGLGETPDRRTVVDVTAEPVPSGGLEICLPVTASLRAESGERMLRLLHYGGSGWEPVAGSRDDAARGRVCASGVVTLSPFAAGYDDLKPIFGDATVAPQRYRKGTEIDPLTLPAATGGDGSLTYTLSPALPEGLEYTAPADATSGGALAGTPAVSAQAAAYTLTVTDSDGDTATLEFTLEVEQDLKPTFGDATVAPQRYVQDTEIARLALPAATGGDGSLTYTLSPALPEGLEYTAPADATSGGALTGTPAVPAQAAAYTLTVTDSDGDTATLEFTLEVEQDLMPTFGDAQVPPQRYVQDTEIARLALPAATGGHGPLAYALTGPGPSGALPEGLVWTPPADATSGGTLTGTPAVPEQESAWTLTATDTDGDVATLTFTVEVAPDRSPTFGDAQVPPQRYMQDTEIARLALPAATGGNGPLVYALTGPGPASVLALPEGLAWSESAATRPTRPGALAGTPTVPAPPAVWTLTATDANGDSATLGFTIEVVDRLHVRLKGVNEAILPDLSRAMTASTMDAVTGRIGQALSPGGATTAPADVLTAFAGILQANEKAIEDGTWSWKQELDGRTFALALSGAGGERQGSGFATGIGTAAGARVTLWGAGDYRNLSGAGKGSAVDWDGHLFGGHLGMDARFGAGGLAGLALSMSEGRFDYTDTSAYALGEKVEGEYESRMRSAHPYLGWAWPAGTHAWVSLGYGRGDITILDGEAGRQTSDSRLRSAAAGGSVRVLSGEGPGVFGPMTVDLKGEAWTARLEVEDNGEDIAGLKVTTHRVRVAAEGSREFALAGGLSFTPSVELGVRFDGGDGETGAGVELGGGVDYAYPAWGLSADVTGRVLLAHQGETEDWSVGGTVRLKPASGLGLSLSLAPSYGDTESGLSRLWEHGVAESGAGATEAGTTDGSPTARLDTEMGYGLAAFAGVLTPYGGFGLSEGGKRGYRLGARFLLGPAFEMGLEGERKESRTDPAEHGLTLSGRMRW